MKHRGYRELSPCAETEGMSSLLLGERSSISDPKEDEDGIIRESCLLTRQDHCGPPFGHCQIPVVQRNDRVRLAKTPGSCRPGGVMELIGGRRKTEPGKVSISWS